MNPNQRPTPHLNGVGGWLLLLIVMLALYLPLADFKNLYDDFIVSTQVLPLLESNPIWKTYRTAIWIVYGIKCFFCFTISYALWKIHRPLTIRLAIGVIWLVGPCALVINAVIATLLFHFDFLQTIKPFYIGIATTAVQSAIWTAYLLRSIRVKNTYYTTQSKLHA